MLRRTPILFCKPVSLDLNPMSKMMNSLNFFRNTFLSICLLGFVVSVTPVFADVGTASSDVVSTNDTSGTKDVEKAAEPSVTAPTDEAPPVDRGAPPAKENIPGGTFMLVAYILMWLCPLAFLWGTHRKVVRLEGNLAELRTAIDKTNE